MKAALEAFGRAPALRAARAYQQNRVPAKTFAGSVAGGAPIVAGTVPAFLLVLLVVNFRGFSEIPVVRAWEHVGPCT